MTKTVTIAATRTNGDPYAHHDVIVTLVAGSAGGVVGSNVIVSQTKVPLNASGQGSIVLATNDVEITSPSTSFYRFTVDGSSPTITRSVRITDALPSTISWTRSGIEVGDPTIPQRDVSSDYVQVAKPLWALDPATLEAAIIAAVVQLFPGDEETAAVVGQTVATQVAGQVDLTTLTDPASLTNVLHNAAELIVHAVAGAGVLGIGLAAASATLAGLLVSTAPNPPGEPSESSTAIWNRTPGNLRAFLDARLITDGPINGVVANGAGGFIYPPPLTRSFLAIYPAFGGVAPVVTDGVIRSTGEAVAGDDPTPRTGFTFEGVTPGTDGRIEWGFAGYTETDATFTTYSPTNVAISAPFDDLPEGAAGPDAYLGGFVVGRFVGDTDATDPGQPVSWRCKIIRDDLADPTTVASAALPRTPVRGDRIAFTWTEANRFAVEFNGVEIVTATDTTHDLTEFTGIGMVMHQGSDGAHTWEDAYYCGVEWFGISAGDQITGDLGPHRWTEQAGWVPIGPGARPASSFGGGSGAVDSVNGETGTVVLSAADVGAPTIAALADLSGVNPALLAEARGNLGLGSLAVKSAIARTDMASGIVDADKLDTSLAAAITAATPNTRTITAGTGLTGGGTLASDRTIAIDTATLARIGTTVEATSDTAARTSTTAVADGVLEFTAAADTSYRIDAYLIFQGDATADLKIGFTIPAGTLHLTVEGALTTVASGSDYDRFLTLTSSGQTAAAGIAGASTPISVRVTGVIRPTSAGTVALVWAPNATGAGTGVTRLARSQIYYRAV